jgi:hypothetical protein
MKIINKIVDHLLLLNSGYDLRNRSAALKVVILGLIFAGLGLIALGVIHMTHG